MNFNENILTATNSERVEFALITILFSIAGSYLYQKKFNREISSDITIYSGLGALAPYICIVGTFVWSEIAAIITGFIFGFLFTYRVS